LRKKYGGRVELIRDDNNKIRISAQRPPNYFSWLTHGRHAILHRQIRLHPRFCDTHMAQLKEEKWPNPMRVSRRSQDPSLLLKHYTIKSRNRDLATSLRF
jgi:hypothetical protein